MWWQHIGNSFPLLFHIFLDKVEPGWKQYKQWIISDELPADNASAARVNMAQPGCEMLSYFWLTFVSNVLRMYSYNHLPHKAVHIVDFTQRAYNLLCNLHKQ